VIFALVDAVLKMRVAGIVNTSIAGKDGKHEGN
jgi:hypothetical protein